MNKSWQVVFAFIVVFLAGGAIGSVFTLRFARPPAPKPAEVASVAKPEEFGPRLMHSWVNSGQLNLTPAQREKIRPIVFDTGEDLRRAQLENAHTGTLLLEHMQDEIAAVLSPAQRDKYFQLIQNQREQFNRRIKEFQRKAMKQAQEASPSAAQ